jgi:nitrate/TMAO reductase-like tetraheme cytochrome c subunit
MACHLESQVTDKGEKVLKASANSCVACHKGRENLLNEWKADLEREIKFTKEVEQEALDALTPAKLSEAKLAEAKKMMAEGKENLNFVQFGNGVHNKKYSLFVLDAAITRFEDVLDFIEENQQ